MKATIIPLLLLFGLSAVHYGCSKDNLKAEEITIDEQNLTPCPDSAACQYLFTERADIQGTIPTFKEGEYRVFWASVTYRGVNSVLYLKAPMDGSSFRLDKKEILEGRAILFRNCPSCLMSPSLPVTEGYVKGINLTPGKRADQTKWLLEAKAIIQDSNSPLRDTIYFKQYFYPNFVYN